MCFLLFAIVDMLFKNGLAIHIEKGKHLCNYLLALSTITA